MPGFEPFDVVAVPFPYVEREARKRRPAVVVSDSALAGRHGLLWVVMVTSAANAPWPDDVKIEDLALAGLPEPSVVRAAKIATVEAGRCERLGRLADEAAAAVVAVLRRVLAAAAG
jgi:mRNA interferase MazF